MSEFTRFRKFVQKTPIGKLAEKGVAGQVLGAVMKKDKPAFNVGNPLERGYARGRAKAQELTGMTGKQVGQDTSHLVQQYKKRAFGDSESTRATQRRAQQRSERLARRGASDSQLRSQEYEAEQNIAQQRHMDQEARLGQYRSILSNLMRTHSSLEPGYAQLELAAARPNPPKRQGGQSTLGSLLGTVGQIGGSYFGGPLGAAVGGGLGRVLGGLFERKVHQKEI